MKNIAFLSEDVGFFISKIKFLPETKIYITDFYMREIREIDREFFLKEYYAYPRVIYNTLIQLIFIEKCEFCNAKNVSKELLIWKLSISLCLKNEKNKLKEWLLLAIGLYNINFEKSDKVLKILRNEKNVEVSTGDLFGLIDLEKEWFKRIRLFSETVQEIEGYWNWYDTNNLKIKELKKLKEIVNLEPGILELEKYKDFFEESQKNIKYSEEGKKIFQGYSYKTIDSYIKWIQANFINKINSLIDNNKNKVKVTREGIYLECFGKREVPTIRNILRYKRAPEYKDFYNLKKIIEYLKEKRKKNLIEYENYNVDLTYIACLKFEIFKILKDYPLSDTYLKFNYQIKDNWFKAIEKHKIKGKIYYVLREMNESEYKEHYVWQLNSKFLYKKDDEKMIGPYDEEKKDYIIGKIYTEDEIEKFNHIYLWIDKTLN